MSQHFQYKRPERLWRNGTRLMAAIRFVNGLSPGACPGFGVFQNFACNGETPRLFTCLSTVGAGLP